MEVVVDLSLQPETKDDNKAAKVWQGAFDKLNQAAQFLHHSEKPQLPLPLADLISMEFEDDASCPKPSQLESQVVTTSVASARNASLLTGALPQNPASNELRNSEAEAEESATRLSRAACSPSRAQELKVSNADTGIQPELGMAPDTSRMVPLSDFATPLKPLSTTQSPRSNSIEAVAVNATRHFPHPNALKAPLIVGDSPPVPADSATSQQVPPPPNSSLPTKNQPPSKQANGSETESSETESSETDSSPPCNLSLPTKNQTPSTQQTNGSETDSSETVSSPTCDPSLPTKNQSPSTQQTDTSETNGSETDSSETDSSETDSSPLPNLSLPTTNDEPPSIEQVTSSEVGGSETDSSLSDPPDRSQIDEESEDEVVIGPGRSVHFVDCDAGRDAGQASGSSKQPAAPRQPAAKGARKPARSAFTRKQSASSACSRLCNFC